jgi:transcriptional regulator with XRE-family HTH domain
MMGNVDTATELGTLLRGWRDRLAPADVGLAGSAPRRAAGLRREEVAVLAGISADYVVRLEQGRVASPSAQVCAALARALRLSDDEQAHLFRLAGHATGNGALSRLVPASVGRLLDQLDGNPVAVYDAMWTLLRWNRHFTALHGDPPGHDDPRGRNVLWRHFTGLPTRVRHTPAELVDFETSMVADLRAAAGRYPRDRALAALVDDLIEASPRFGTLWSQPTVVHHDQDHKIFDHPEVGPVEVDCDALTTQRGDLRVVVYSAAPGTDAHTKLALLATLGTQRLTT